MSPEELAKLTDKRIRKFTLCELSFSIDELKDYPVHMEYLLDAIRTQDDYYYMGRILMDYLRLVNSDDISLHEGV